MEAGRVIGFPNGPGPCCMAGGSRGGGGRCWGQPTSVWWPDKMP